MQEMATLEMEAAAALDALHKGNVELNGALDDLQAASSEEASYITEMGAESKAGDDALEQCSKEDEVQAQAEAEGAGSVESLKAALGDLSSNGKDLEGAANANTASEKDVGLLEKKVAALL